MAVGDAHVLPGFLTPVLAHIYFQSHRLLKTEESEKFIVRGREVERRPCNHEVQSSSPGSGSQLPDFSLANTFGASTGVDARKQNRERD